MCHEERQLPATKDVHQILKQVKAAPIVGKKFNYCLDPSIQNYQIFKCLITVSADDEELVIYNLRPELIKGNAKECTEKDHDAGDENGEENEDDVEQMFREPAGDTKSIYDNIKIKPLSDSTGGKHSIAMEHYT